MYEYAVFVDDNFHYQDEGERYKLGEFDKWETAVAACKKIADDFLAQNYKPGMTAEELYKIYTSFGEDPFILKKNPDAPPRSGFSTWDYAKERCQQICAG